MDVDKRQVANGASSSEKNQAGPPKNPLEDQPWCALNENPDAHFPRLIIANLPNPACSTGGLDTARRSDALCQSGA